MTISGRALIYATPPVHAISEGFSTLHMLAIFSSAFRHAACFYACASRRRFSSAIWDLRSPDAAARQEFQRDAKAPAISDKDKISHIKKHMHATLGPLCFWRDDDIFALITIFSCWQVHIVHTLEVRSPRVSFQMPGKKRSCL